jgi:hypothetical protein
MKQLNNLIDKLHFEACQNFKNGYIDPETGRFVLTKYYLLSRGFCCNSKCRHCPYGEKK